MVILDSLYYQYVWKLIPGHTYYEHLSFAINLGVKEVVL
jgi:hypothetical protein